MVKDKKSYFDDAPRISSLNFQLYAMFTYDAETLREQVVPASIFTNHRAFPFTPGLNENLANVAGNSVNDAVKKQGNIHDNQSDLNALPPPRSNEFITLNALVKEPPPTDNLGVAVPEKIEPGDIYASKYYPLRKKNTDQGHILNLEARLDLPELAEHMHEMLQLIVFVDTSAITMEQSTWASELNHTTINGGGLGINWAHRNNFVLQVYFANELESQVQGVPPVLSQQFWVQTVKYF